jgi:hypothetical protein
MTDIRADLSQRIQTLERELRTALVEKERTFRYHWDHGKAQFETDALAEHRKLKQGLSSYIFQSRWLAIVTAPVVAARTEQHWCPIKQALRLRSPHSARAIVGSSLTHRRLAPRASRK